MNKKQYRTDRGWFKVFYGVFYYLELDKKPQFFASIGILSLYLCSLMAFELVGQNVAIFSFVFMGAAISVFPKKYPWPLYDAPGLENR